MRARARVRAMYADVCSSFSRCVRVLWVVVVMVVNMVVVVSIFTALVRTYVLACVHVCVCRVKCIETLRTTRTLC